MKQIQQYVAKRIYDSKGPNDIIYKRFQDTEIFYSINGGSIAWRTEEYLLRECNRNDDYRKVEPVEPQEDTFLDYDAIEEKRQTEQEKDTPLGVVLEEISQALFGVGYEKYPNEMLKVANILEKALPKVAVGTDTNNIKEKLYSIATDLGTIMACVQTGNYEKATKREKKICETIEEIVGDLGKSVDTPTPPHKECKCDEIREDYPGLGGCSVCLGDTTNRNEVIDECINTIDTMITRGGNLAMLRIFGDEFIKRLEQLKTNQ